MNSKKVSSEDEGNTLQGADDNIIQTFQLEETQLRGRAVRVGDVLSHILDTHDYPEPVAQLTAETVILALLLSSMLKYDGIFTLQTKGDGPISMLVADVTSSGNVRACATFDAQRLKNIEDNAAFEECVGKGHLAFTVDQSGSSDRYQGIVDLAGGSLVDCIQHYFAQSEQIGTGIKMAVSKRGKSWRGGAIMIQHMPEDRKNFDINKDSTREDDWRRSMILLNSCTDQELLDPALHSNALLYRLFHEEGVRVYEPKKIQHKCRCDKEKVKAVLTGLSKDDIEYMINEQGKIEVRCEFCSQIFLFDKSALESVKHN